MKAFLKKFMPALAFTIAIAGALSTNSSHAADKKVVPIQGYLNTPNPCTPSIQCNTTGQVICSTGGSQVWGMVSPGNCSRKVFHLNQ